MAFFRDHPGEPVPEEKTFSGSAREDNRETHRPCRWAPLHWANQRPTFIIRHFYAESPSCRNPPTLFWLGTGTKYAGLHTQWRAFPLKLSVN